MKYKKQFSREEFFSSVALLVISFTAENKEPRLLSNSSAMSAYLGGNCCAHLLLLLGTATLFSFLPLR